jgi:SAM-dependent methyltransferase
MFLNPQQFFDESLVNLGDTHDESYDEIFAPVGFSNIPKQGVSSQFIEDAESYHKKLFNPELLQRQFSPQLKLLHNLPDDALVLDVGSGSGNSIFALFNLLPKCTILATDISEHILVILRREALKSHLDCSRLGISCADLHSIKLASDKFDLVVGGSILHHLYDPVVALCNIRNGLKIGGEAIFVEPFEGSWGFLKIAWQTILEDSHIRKGLGDKEHALMKSFVWQWEIRKGTDKTGDALKNFDDKWLFTRAYFNDAASQASLNVRIVPYGTPSNLCSVLTNQVMDNFLGSGLWFLPDWAIAILQRFDNGFSSEMKEELFAGAVVIFQKN